MGRLSVPKQPYGSSIHRAQNGVHLSLVNLSCFGLVLVLLASECAADEQLCAMRGSCVPHKVCKTTPSGLGPDSGAGWGLSAPNDCPFPGDGAPCKLEASTPPGKAEEIAPSIEEVCPGVFSAADLVCCDDDQLASLKKQLNMAHGLLGSCPACWANFLAFWCTFTCSPNQSSFLNVTKSSVCNAQEFPDPNGQSSAGCAGTKSDQQQIAAVQSVSVALDRAYAENLFQSCKDVTVSATGQKAMIMAFGGSTTVEQFLEFQGHEAYASGQSPMDIKFDVGKKGTGGAAMKSKIVPCETQDPAFACLCSDCNKACPSPPGEVHDSPVYHANLSFGTFNVLVLFAAALVIDVYLLAGASMTIESEDLSKGKDGQQSNRLSSETSFSEAQDNHGSIAVHDSNLMAQSEPETYVQMALSGLGELVGEHPIKVVLFWVVVTIASGCVLWIHPLEVLTDPVKLWAQKGSRALVDRSFFNDHFGPFWRTEMIIFKPKPLASTFDVLMSMLQLQQKVEELKVSCDDMQALSPGQTCDKSEVWALNQMCYQPSPGAGCLVESATEFWQMNGSRLALTPGCSGPDHNMTMCDLNLKSKLNLCASKGAVHVECWSRAQIPQSFPKILFGSSNDDFIPSESEAFVATYLLENDQWTAPRAAAWERKVIDVLQGYNNSAVDITFSTEASLEMELARGGNADIPTIGISYLVMLLYVTCSLGQKAGRSFERRLLMACTGVTIVGMSLVISASICSLLGIQATLIMSEVIPFLALAIGVDNIFILVWAFDASDGQDSMLQSRCGLALQRVGPSIFCAAVAESIAFLFGSDTGMPAVVAFAQFAAVSVCVGSLMQLSLFVSVLSALEETNVRGQAGTLQENLLESGNSNVESENEDKNQEQKEAEASGDCFSVTGFDIFDNKTRTYVLALAGMIVLAAVLSSSMVSLGLNQNEALPQDSYLVDYFADEFNLVQVGAPVFFVVSDRVYRNNTHMASPLKDRVHFGDVETIQKLCSRPGCRRNSLGNSVANAARFENYTYIATGSSNWANDYLSWLTTSLTDASHACCRYRLNEDGSRGDMCPPYWTPELHPGKTLDPSCACNSTLRFKSPACPSAPEQPCEVAGGCLSPDLPDSAFVKYNKTSGAGKCWGVRLSGLCPRGGEMPFCSKDCYSKFGDYERACLATDASFPNGSEVSTFFSDFLSSECPSDPNNAFCGVCGRHYYSDLADLSLSVAGLHGQPVPASLEADVDKVVAVRHMAYHSRLSKQQDFIRALRYAYALAGNLSATLDLEVSVYSVWYVFFEQYLTVEWAAMKVSVLCLLAVFAVVLCTLGSLTAAALVFVTALSIELVLIGVMGAWGISLNALSTVNLVAAIGISVEFSVHIVHAYLRTEGSRVEKSKDALEGVGTAVFTGIAMTKLLGVVVLAFAHSKIFITYYFRMYFSLVVVGSFYGLLVLPVLLSILGPMPDKDDEFPPAVYSISDPPQTRPQHPEEPEEEISIE